MTTESPPPGGGRRPLFDLSGLVESLHQLYLQVSRHLLHRRLQSHNSEAPAQDANIERRLGRRLENVAAQAGISAAEQDSSESAAARPEPWPKRPAPPTSGSKPGGLGARLARRLRRRSGGSSQPQLSEKMQAATWEHINKAQLLARQGKLESARMHAGLAENAMETASRYMGEDEYADFKSTVEERIKSIKAD